MFEELSINYLIPTEKMTINVACERLSKQTSLWHKNSPKKVSAAIFVKSLKKAFSGQNIGISKVTGTLCAERAAIASIVSSHPEVRFEDLSILAVVAEDTPILPCGVCCEWLFKINPNMVLLTFNKTKTRVFRLKLKELFYDEGIFLNGRVSNHDNNN